MITILLAVLVVSSSSIGSSEKSEIVKNVSLIEADAGEILARGYVEAFDELKSTLASLFGLKWEDKEKLIDEARSIERRKSVLIAKNRRSKSFLVHAKNVLYFTDDPEEGRGRSF